MRQLSTQLSLFIRGVKNRQQQAQQMPEFENLDKIKFTEEQITEMGQYRMQQGGARNVVDMFKQKFQGRTRRNTRREARSSAELTEDKLQEEEQQQEEDFMNEKQKLSPRMEKRSKANKKEKFLTFKIYKHLEMLKETKQKKLKDANTTHLVTENDRLASLSHVRLIQQYLPYDYMRQVQKVMHKYDQTQLRDIAFHFSNLMRLRYNQQKINYEDYPHLNFQKLQDKLPHHRKVEQIYLTGKDKIFQQRQQTQQKVQKDPIQPQIKYSQNIVVSYLLNRVPRTYAVAFRVISQIRKMFPEFQPVSFMDFGAGLSCGSVAFIQTYGDTGAVYSVQPAGKMRKMAKFLTEYSKIVHFQSLAQLSSQVRQLDIVYCAYVLNQIRSQLTPVYLQSLYSKVKTNGFLVIVEYGNPYGARLIHQTRKWALTKKIRIAAPCPHHLKCPLASSKHWCHFDQPAGMYPREVFGKLPNDNSTKLQKYSYIIIQKLEDETSEGQIEIPKYVEPNVTHEWDRVLFPLMKKGGHYIYTLCTRNGRFQRRITSKSHGQQYKEGRRLKWGDFWRFGSRIPNRYRKERRTGRRLW